MMKRNRLGAFTQPAERTDLSIEINGELRTALGEN